MFCCFVYIICFFELFDIGVCSGSVTLVWKQWQYWRWWELGAEGGWSHDYLLTYFNLV